MKRIVLLLSLCILIAGQGFGQKFKFAFLDSPQIINVPVDGDDGTGERFIYFNVTNISEEPISLMAYRSFDYAPGHSSYFCWDLCYPEWTDSSGTAVLLLPGDTTSFAQYLTFKTGDTPGYSEITMTIQDSVTEEQIEYTFQLSVGGVMSVEDKLLDKEALSNPYPNPAKNEAYAKVELPVGIREAKLQVFNLIGKRVLEVPVASRIGTIRMPLETLNSGMYFLYLVGDGEEISSRKLIITK